MNLATNTHELTLINKFSFIRAYSCSLVANLICGKKRRFLNELNP